MNKKKEKLYRVYNPTVNAYQSVNREMADKFIEAAKKVEKIIKEENDEQA